MVRRKFVVAHVQQRLPTTLMARVAMMENILWLTIGVLLGLIVLFYVLS